MAKTTFSKLNCKINTDTVLCTFNEQSFTVKQYLPINEKLALIGRVVEAVYTQEDNYNNILKAKALLALEILYSYSDIGFTDKQKEDPAKMFDLCESSGLFTVIRESIPQKELQELENATYTIINNFYAYQNSAVGIINNIKNNADNLNIDVSKLGEYLNNKENFSFLKDIMDKMG